MPLNGTLTCSFKRAAVERRGLDRGALCMCWARRVPGRRLTHVRVIPPTEGERSRRKVRSDIYRRPAIDYGLAYRVHRTRSRCESAPGNEEAHLRAVESWFAFIAIIITATSKPQGGGVVPRRALFIIARSPGSMVSSTQRHAFEVEAARVMQILGRRSRGHRVRERHRRASQRQSSRHAVRSLRLLWPG
jgi:hypothetical protein